MIEPRELVEHVEFESGFDARILRYNQQLGFLQVDERELSIDGIRLVGFSTPISREGGIDTNDVVTPLTEFADLPDENRVIDQQGKGVGPRVFNTRATFGGTKTRPDFIGVYSFDLDTAKLLDGRLAQGGKVRRIARHAGRMIQSKVTSLESVVSKIHESYGNADAVELEVPPHPALRQALHGVENPSSITPQFILIRNPHILLNRHW
jgi:hypothetical protein